MSDLNEAAPVSPSLLRFGVAALLLALALLQLGPMVHDRPEGPWFLYGSDTVSHDIPVHLWVWEHLGESGGRLPLWMAPLKGGLPVIGAFLWTPFCPAVWGPALLPFPLAQRLEFVLALWWGGLGAWWLARVLGMRRESALLVGVAFCLSGHVVTLIHAGHLQKVLALAWLPWFAGGALKALSPSGGRSSVVRGIAVAGLSLGMAFLSGHPQIAYLMAMLLVARGLWEIVPGPGRPRVLGRASAILGLGGLIAAGQLLPGMEMGAVSNRADGVPYHEAVETSYPPLETFELLLPRFLGDNSETGYGVYFGDWGQRIVSDYAGALVVGLALGAIFLTKRKREAAFWLAIGFVALFVGFGDRTLIYGLIYDYWPGLSRFRSPGTFLAGVALTLPVLAGFGLEGLVRRAGGRRDRSLPLAFLVIGGAASLAGLAGLMMLDAEEIGPRLTVVAALLRTGLVLGIGLLAGAGVLVFAKGEKVAWVMGALLALIVAVDLGVANAAFLRAVPWESYEAYLAPGPLDLALSEEPEPRRVLELGRELSLRPLLNARDALLGYHPISFGAFEDQLNDLGAGTAAWRQAWGVTHVLVPPGAQELPAGYPVFGRFGGPAGGTLLRDPEVEGPVRLDGRELVAEAFQWEERTANRAVLTVDLAAGGTVEVLETICPGWSMRVDEAEWAAAREVTLERSAEVGVGRHRIEWRYRPMSYRAGLFLTALGLGLFALLLGAGGCRRESVTA